MSCRNNIKQGWPKSGEGAGNRTVGRKNRNSNPTYDSESNLNIYQIYWAVPSQQCLNKTRKPIEPQKFGIKTNKNQKFHGTEVFFLN